MADRFGCSSWLVMETGAPALADALIAFDCRITQAAEMATHTLLIAEVVALGLGEPGSSLMYLHRQYRNLHHPSVERPMNDVAEPDAVEEASMEWL